MKPTEASIALPDPPKTAPQLIGLLRVGSLISGECLVCREVILSRVSPEAEPVWRLIKEVFAKHIRTEHFALALDSRSSES